MGIASAWHTAPPSLEAMPRSSPFSYRRSACRPRNRGDSGVFSSGNCTVILRAKKYLPVMRRPLNSSSSMKLERKSLSEKAEDRVANVLEDSMGLLYLKMLYGVCIHPPITT